MEDDSWAAAEFGGAVLGDARRTARVVDLAETVSQQPQASLPAACADPAQLKTAYRFFASEAVTCAAVLAPHRAATRTRMGAAPVVLAVQDTTDRDFRHHPATTGLGPLKPGQRGLLVHSTLAITPERLPLGLLAQQVWSRDPARRGPPPPRRQRAIAQKESQKWLTSLAAVIDARSACPPTRLISVGDREADVYDLFRQDRPDGVDLRVRAAWDRRVAHPEGYRWAAMADAPVLATATVDLPRRGGQPARVASLTIRAQPVTLRPPRHRTAERLPSVTVWVVWALEEPPPVETPPLEWLLLTTASVQTADDARERLDWYAARWGIEVWHRVLKSGCRIEARELADAANLQRCLALDAVIAWRLLSATILVRTLPDAPCTILLTTAECQALSCTNHRVPTPPPDPPSLRPAVRWIGQLGGFLGRTRDGDPGVTALWQGGHRLADLSARYAIMKPSPPRDVGKG